MSLEETKAEANRLVALSNTEELAEMTAFAIRTSPAIEQTIRRLWPVIIANAKPDPEEAEQ
jgi:hypothetical protein